jgi:LuxR family maltose regulon positive regulatory protein
MIDTSPTNWLALTKLAPPELRPDLIVRQRLLDRLSRALGTCRFTLVSAPAGSGKTSLLSALARATSQVVFIWISLDENDNDPARFCIAVSTALQSHIPGVSLPDGSTPEQLQHWLTRLINTLLAAGDFRCVLVLDDLHLINDPAIFTLLDQLIERMPQQLRLIAATRHDPPLSLARMRVRRWISELHLHELRFTPGEATAWLNTALRLDLPASQISALVERTEGWAAGISLLASSLEHIDSPAERIAFLEHVHRTDRAIFAFLAEEVLNRQDPLEYPRH